jgi:hypothetical protein
MIISQNNITLEYMLFLDEDVQVTGTSCSFRNCTIYGGRLDADESLTLENTIVYNPEGSDIDIAAGKTVTARNNCFKHQAAQAAAWRHNQRRYLAEPSHGKRWRLRGREAAGDRDGRLAQGRAVELRRYGRL